ncbi:TIM barrel protein [Chloroflexota bacterium]
MAQLLFGTAGTPHSAKTRTTIDGIRRIAELGLGCMEIEFVQGVRMGEAGARLVAETAAGEGVKLSAHAPYFLNFNAHELEKIKASQERLLHTARIASLCGAQSVVFHTAFYLGDPPEKAYNTVKKYLEETLNQLKRENNRLWIRPELMGKPSQFGTLDEILRLCIELEGMAPCIDFAHYHARTGAYNSYQEFTSILQRIEERLGRAALDDMHIHFSGIRYGARRFDRALKAIKIAITVSTVSCLLVFLALYFSPEPLISIFTTDSELITLSAYAARRIFLVIYLIGFLMVSSLVFQSIGKAVQSFITSIARPFLFLIPLVFILPRFLELDGVLLAFPIADVLTFLLTLILFIPTIREIKRAEVQAKSGQAADAGAFQQGYVRKYPGRGRSHGTT